jgi:hypothetical protein
MARLDCLSVMKISPQEEAISGAPPPPGRRVFGLVVVADHSGVDVAETVDLGGAEKADGDAPALKPVAEHFRHRDRGDRRVAEFAVADRQGSTCGAVPMVPLS